MITYFDFSTSKLKSFWGYITLLHVFIKQVVGSAELLFSEVLSALHMMVQKRSGSGSLVSNMKAPESRRQTADLEGMLQNEKAEFEVRPLDVHA